MNYPEKRAVVHAAWLLVAFVAVVAADDGRIEARSFNIPLPYLSIVFNEDSSLDEVFISYPESNEGWGISYGDDRYVKITRRSRRDHHHREQGALAGAITEFEAEQLNRVLDGLVKSLKILERDLQRGRWGRCLYHDRYLPQFLKGLYFLVRAVRCSADMAPSQACPPDTLFAQRGNSLESRERIQIWRSHPELVTRLRIAAHELAFQARQWQKRELRNRKRDRWKDRSGKFGTALGLFVKLYFARHAPDTVESP